MKIETLQAICKQHPLPWSWEDDWTCEVLDANGVAVTKIPLQDRWLAQLVVALANESEALKSAMPSTRQRDDG